MAANTQFAHQAFQAAESGIAQVLASLGTLGSTSPLLNTQGTAVAGGPYYFNKDPNGSFTDGTDKYLEQATISVQFKPPVGKLIEGVSLGANFSAYHFGASSTGQSSAGGESVHVQGFYIIGPG